MNGQSAYDIARRLDFERDVLQVFSPLDAFEAMGLASGLETLAHPTILSSAPGSLVELGADIPAQFVYTHIILDISCDLESMMTLSLSSVWMHHQITPCLRILEQQEHALHHTEPESLISSSPLWSWIAKEEDWLTAEAVLSLSRESRVDVRIVLHYLACRGHFPYNGASEWTYMLQHINDVQVRAPPSS